MFASIYMGSCYSTSPVAGTIIIDSIVITNSKMRIKDNAIKIPITSLRTGQSSVLTISKKDKCFIIERGHGAHDELLRDITEHTANTSTI